MAAGCRRGHDGGDDDGGDDDEPTPVRRLTPAAIDAVGGPLTNFERKFIAAGEAVYELVLVPKEGAPEPEEEGAFVAMAGMPLFAHVGREN